MENKKGIPSTTIMLDKTYDLKFGFGAQRRFKDLIGISIEEAVSTDFDREMAVNALWVMMLKHNPEITTEQVDDLLDEHFEGSATDAISFISDVVAYSLSGKTVKELEEDNTEEKNAHPPTQSQ